MEFCHFMFIKTKHKNKLKAYNLDENEIISFWSWQQLQLATTSGKTQKIKGRPGSKVDETKQIEFSW